MAAGTPNNTTVVIPAWDGYVGEPLHKALASLARSPLAAPPRVIVVDNCSAVPVGPLGPDVEVVRSERRLSLGAARNLGLDRVTTPYVIFWDADDEMLEGALAMLEGAIDSDPGLVACGMAIVETPSGRRHRWPRRWLRTLVKAPRLLALLDCVWSQFPTTGATIIRTDAARSGGGFADADSGEDWCLGVSLAFRGRIGWSEQPGRAYRTHPESVWARHMTLAHQRRHADAVRARIREDSAIPTWVRALLPLIAAAQHAALAAHGVVALVRGRRRNPWRSG